MSDQLKINWDRLNLAEACDFEGANLIARLETNEKLEEIYRELHTMNRLKAYELMRSGIGDRQQVRKILDEDLLEIVNPEAQTRLNQIGILVKCNSGVD